MTDLSQTIAAKSDQLNADDLIGAPRTITVTKVSRMQEPDQPIAIGFQGDGGKPYKPCKSMRRVLVMVWGADGTAYVGRRMTIYRDDKVRFGNAEVGGIRISHMSDISQPVTMALTVTRANRKPFTVAPLRDDPTPARGPAKLLAKAREKAGLGPGVYAEWVAQLKAEQRAALAPINDELQQRMADAEAQADRASADEETV